FTWIIRYLKILLVAFHSMIATFMATGIIPAYDAFAEQYNVTLPYASYLNSSQVYPHFGISPLLWSLITVIYGRYHITLLSVLGSMVCNIAGAECTSYGGQMATRVLRAILYIFWIFAILKFCQFVFYLTIGDETIYNPDNERKATGFWGKLIPRKISSHALKPLDFVAPFFLAKYPRILIMACAHAITFCYGNIAMIVEMPPAFGRKFKFDAPQIGLQFSGPMSDWLLKRIRKSTGNSCPADGLWLSYFAFAAIFTGLLTWGF
ncbi:hypothetical protein N7463_009613, partial [Penicillium fimorum]